MFLPVLFFVPCVVASADPQCEPKTASGEVLLQAGTQRQSAPSAEVKENPFALEQHAGCRKMITHCLTRDDADQAPRFYEANWSAWQLGFDSCCNSQYNEALCYELDRTIFDFSARTFGPGDLVKDTPDPALADFCQEAEDLMDAHFAEAAFENSTLQAQLLQKTATSSRIVQKVITKAGLLSLKELLYKSDAKTRARVVRRHIEACRASACWDQVFLLQSFFLKLGINKYGACFQSGARVNLTDGSMTSVGSLSANDMVWGRGRVQKFKLKERPIKFDTSDSYEGFFCNLATGFKKLTLSGGRPPFYLGRNAEVWVLKNKDPEAADALNKSDDPKEGDELITFGEAGKATGGVFVTKVEEPIAEMEMCGPEVQAPDFFVEGISVSCDPGNGQGWQLPARLLAVIALLVLC